MKTYLDKLRIPVSIILLLAGIFWIWYSRIPADTLPSSSFQAAQVGFIAPDFKLDNIDSGILQLSDFRGKPVIINFWASWCPPCKAEMPAFQEAHQEYSATDLEIIAINAANQDSIGEVIQFINQNGITFPIALDRTGSTSVDYQVHSLPTTYFIDKNGVIQDIIIGGPIPLSLLRIQAEQLLME